LYRNMSIHIANSYERRLEGVLVNTW